MRVIRNGGTINGSIVLASGNDKLHLRGGTVIGVVAGGAGNDTYMVSDRDTELLENENGGTDIVKSKVAYKLGENFENLTLLGSSGIDGRGNDNSNTIVGNTGANRLFGEKGSDILNGGRGNDRLTGGGGSDLFLFRPHFGHDMITDFENGEDYFSLSQVSSVAEFNQLKRDHVKVSGHDLVIHYGDDVLTLHDMKMADLDITDFVKDFAG